MMQGTTPRFFSTGPSATVEETTSVAAPALTAARIQNKTVEPLLLMPALICAGTAATAPSLLPRPGIDRGQGDDLYHLKTPFPYLYRQLVPTNNQVCFSWV